MTAEAVRNPLGTIIAPFDPQKHDRTAFLVGHTKPPPFQTHHEPTAVLSSRRLQSVSTPTSSETRIATAKRESDSPQRATST